MESIWGVLRGRGLRSVAAMTLGGAAVATGVGVIAPAGIAAADCADVIVVGAAGSGERDGTGAGVGAKVEATYRNLAADLESAGVSAELRPVEYPATAVPAGLDLGQWSVFLDSVRAGADTATAVIGDAISGCPDSSIVVAGYSQGAMAIHRALQRIGPAEAIVAGVLIGDGDRIANDSVQVTGIGPVDGAIGVGQQFAVFSGANPAPLAAPWGSRILSACNQGDPVCAFGSPLNPDVPDPHLSYDPESWRSFVFAQVVGG